MKGKYTFIIKLFTVLIFAIILEIFVFNFDSISIILDSSLEKNKSYTLEQLEKINWILKGDYIESLEDPILIIYDVNTKVKKINIKGSSNVNPSNITVFYTNNKHQTFNGDMIKVFENKEINQCSLNLNVDAKDLRFDLGDEAGFILKDIEIIINPAILTISFSRIIAIIIIYLLGIGLFSLQKNPNYNLEN